MHSDPLEGSGRSRQGHQRAKWPFMEAEAQSCPSKLFSKLQLMLQALLHVLGVGEATVHCAVRGNSEKLNWGSGCSTVQAALKKKVLQLVADPRRKQ